MSRRLLASISLVVVLASTLSACCGSTCIKEPPCKPTCGCSAPAAK
jgi:hypothetical protein